MSKNPNTPETIIHRTLDEQLQSSDYYFNRELSLLKFNQRVFELALDKGLPILERLKFLCICCQNLDEFFEIRVAQLKEQVALGRLAPNMDGLDPEETLERINQQVQPLVKQQYDLFNNEIIGALDEIGIHLLPAHKWSEPQVAWLKRFFKNEIQPILTPIGLDLSHPFPRLINKSLNFIVELEGIDAFGRDSGLAIIHAPRALPRVLPLPASISRDQDFVLLGQVLEYFVKDIFPGMEVKGCYQFRLTRNSDVFLDADGIEDLPRALQGELFSRRYGRAVRLEISQECPSALRQFLQKKFQLTDAEVYAVNGPVNLSRLFTLAEISAHNDLKFKPFTPQHPRELKDKNQIFKHIAEKDILLHHPYQSFRPIIDFVEMAAQDPNVLAIKQTLYRTGARSSHVQALIEAAKAGKEVTAVIELRARFDEADNIELANRLQEAGALVVYGIFGYKTHAKMTLVVRKEGKKLKRYVHLGTGNYHNENAKMYTDYSLLTADKDICIDVHKVFLQLTGMGKAFRLKRLMQAPFSLRRKLIDLIDREIEHKKQGKAAHIIIKVNSLSDAKFIKALYRASAHGVKIDLIVRGICCLVPGIKGISEHITVRSIVGRFLEHSRVYYFSNDETPILYCASADCMERNFNYRVEVAFPILDPKLIESVKNDALLTYLSDNYFSWELQSDGTYERLNGNDTGNSKSAQEIILDYYKPK